MAMQIDTNYDHFRTDYSERVKEKQAAERAEEAKGTEAQRAGKSSQPQDEYISSEKSEQKPSGLYRAGHDAKGNRKIFFEDPKAGGKSQGQPAEKCVADTHKVDGEIKRLKEEKQQLEQQIQSASGDEEIRRKLEKKLAQVENELSRKDNDTYRRQNTSVIRI